MARREVLYTSPGYPYTVLYDVTYRVHVDEAESMYDAEDKAWEILETVMPDKNDDYQRAEVDETKDIKLAFGGGYDVTLLAKFEIYVVSYDFDDACDEAIDYVDGIDLPAGVTQVLVEQTELNQVGDRILILHGDDV